MKKYIAKDGQDEIVGKFEQNFKPVLPNEINVLEVDDLSNYQIDYWYNDV